MLTMKSLKSQSVRNQTACRPEADSNASRHPTDMLSCDRRLGRAGRLTTHVRINGAGSQSVTWRSHGQEVKAADGQRTRELSHFPCRKRVCLLSVAEEMTAGPAEFTSHSQISLPELLAIAASSPAKTHTLSHTECKYIVVHTRSIPEYLLLRQERLPSENRHPNVTKWASR